MIPIRESPETTVNPDLVTPKPVADESNLAWLKRTRWKNGVLLLGGTSLLDFRMRVAQSVLRGDLTPSYWSVCGLLTGSDDQFMGVPLAPADASAVPAANAVQTLHLSDYDDPVAWPNICVLRFADDPARGAAACAAGHAAPQHRRPARAAAGMAGIWMGGRQHGQPAARQQGHPRRRVRGSRALAGRHRADTRPVLVGELPGGRLAGGQVVARLLRRGCLVRRCGRRQAAGAPRPLPAPPAQRHARAAPAAPVTATVAPARSTKR